jgi:magnesium-transporting ATPase (P-type)
MYGENFFPPPRIKSLGEIVCANFEDFINRVLLGACIVSLIIGNIKEHFPEGCIEGTSIAIALTIIIVVGSSNEYSASQRLRKLIAMS